MGQSTDPGKQGSLFTIPVKEPIEVKPVKPARKIDKATGKLFRLVRRQE